MIKICFLLYYSLLTLLEGMRYGENAPPQTQKRKRLNMEPGKSVGAADLSSISIQGMALTSNSCPEFGEVDDFGQEDINRIFDRRLCYFYF